MAQENDEAGKREELERLIKLRNEAWRDLKRNLLKLERALARLSGAGRAGGPLLTP